MSVSRGDSVTHPVWLTVNIFVLISTDKFTEVARSIIVQHKIWNNDIWAINFAEKLKFLKLVFKDQNLSLNFLLNQNIVNEILFLVHIFFNLAYFQWNILIKNLRKGQQKSLNLESRGKINIFEQFNSLINTSTVIASVLITHGITCNMFWKRLSSFQ